MFSLNSVQERDDQHKRGESPSEALFSLTTVQERVAHHKRGDSPSEALISSPSVQEHADHHKRGVSLSEALIWIPPYQERAVPNVQSEQSKEIPMNSRPSIYNNQQKPLFDKIPCWYTNATSLNNKMPELRASIEIDRPKLIFITETWWNQSSVPNLESYTLYRNDRMTSRGGGVAIYVDNSIKSSETAEPSLLNAKEQVWCVITAGSESILLGCIYRPHTNDPIEEVNMNISTAKRLASTTYNGLLLCGDFNLPTITYEGANAIKDDHVISTMFVDNISDTFLTQFTTKPTFQLDETTANNTLDLVFAECDNRIDEIQHYPPIISSLSSLKKCHHVLKWDFKVIHKNSHQPHPVKKVYSKTDFNKMNQHFENINWETEFINKDVNACYEHFLKHYNYACDKFVPTKISKPHHKPNKWMNSSLKDKMKKKKTMVKEQSIWF